MYLDTAILEYTLVRNSNQATVIVGNEFTKDRKWTKRICHPVHVTPHLRITDGSGTRNFSSHDCSYQTPSRPTHKIPVGGTPCLRLPPMAQIPPRPGGIPTSPDKSVVFAFTAALGLGFYLITFIFAIRWLLFADEGWRLRKVVNRPTVFVTLFTFVLTMVYTGLDLKGAMDQVRLLMTNPGLQYTTPLWMDICRVKIKTRERKPCLDITLLVHICKPDCSRSRYNSCKYVPSLPSLLVW